MKNLYVISNNLGDADGDGFYYLIDPEEGSALYSHLCSNRNFAFGDLVFDRPERITDLNLRFGEGQWEVKDRCPSDEYEKFMKRNRFWKFLAKARNLYREDKNLYHTFEHIKNMFFQFSDFEDEFDAEIGNENIENLFWAIAFHDCVYFPGNPENEELSAQLMEKTIGNELDVKSIGKIRDLIVSTRVGRNRGDYDTKLHDVLHDLDWSGFIDFDRMVENEKKIISEAMTVGSYSEQESLEGQLKFYELFADRNLYRTYTFLKFNEIAKENIKKRIGQMKSEKIS